MRTFKTVDEIKKERLLNRENKIIYNLLSVVLSELDRRPNLTVPVSEDDIYKNIKKLYEAAIECGNTEEEKYLEEFIRKMIPEDELREEIRWAIDGGAKGIGDVMKYLNTEIPGQFDGKVASTIAKEMFF